MKLFLVFVLVVAGATSLLAQPTVNFQDPIPPQNLIRTQGQRCPGVACVDDCTFALSNLTTSVKFAVPNGNVDTLRFAIVDLLDESGNELAESKFLVLGGSVQTNQISWTGTKAVVCGGQETLTVRVQAFLQRVVGTTTNLLGTTNSLKFKLVCVPCETVTRTESSGPTVLPHSTQPQTVRLGAMVVNTGLLEHELSVTAASLSGWLLTVETPVLPLAGGAGVEVFFEAIVPAGTLDGVAEPVTVLAEIPGVPGSSSAATLLIVVDTPLRLRVAEFNPKTGSTLEVTGPWAREVLIEVSTNLTHWGPFHQGVLPPGLENLILTDDVVPESGGRFYRARLVEPGALRSRGP